jgi:hypothetical protein
MQIIEPPTEHDVTTLLGAISAESRLTWEPLPSGTSDDELSNHHYLDAARWLAERKDQEELIDTFRRFRVPPGALRTGQALPQAQIRSSKLRERFAGYLTGIGARFNRPTIDSSSVPTPSPPALIPNTELPFEPPASAPPAADSLFSDELSEGSTARVDSLASTHIFTKIPTSPTLDPHPFYSVPFRASGSFAVAGRRSVF